MHTYSKLNISEQTNLRNLLKSGISFEINFIQSKIRFHNFVQYTSVNCYHIPGRTAPFHVRNQTGFFANNQKLQSRQQIHATYQINYKQLKSSI